MNKLLIRDCFQQAKTIHRLMLNLQDDLGDAAATCTVRLSDTNAAQKELEALSDTVCELEATYQKMREQLDKLSR